ncbi:MAG: hypothetical protein KA140_07470 [Caldisericia bacterium]|nr:hypothetical protein [Caldisericia bacterium]
MKGIINLYYNTKNKERYVKKDDYATHQNHQGSSICCHCYDCDCVCENNDYPPGCNHDGD